MIPVLDRKIQQRAAILDFMMAGPEPDGSDKAVRPVVGLSGKYWPNQSALSEDLFTSRLRVTPDIAGAKEPRGHCLAGFFAKMPPAYVNRSPRLRGNFGQYAGHPSPTLDIFWSQLDLAQRLRSPILPSATRF
jgi:hypothetical protein